MSFDIPMNEVETDTGAGSWELLPDMDIKMRATSVEEKRNKVQGARLVFEFEITAAGDHLGKRIIMSFNHQHPNSETVRIALGQLKAFALGCGAPESGRLNMGLLQKCLGRDFVGRVRVDKGSNGYSDRNKVAGFFPANAPQYFGRNPPTAGAPTNSAPTTSAPQADAFGSAPVNSAPTTSAPANSAPGNPGAPVDDVPW